MPSRLALLTHLLTPHTRRTLFEAPARTGPEPRTGYRGILIRLNVLDRAEQSAILKSVLVKATGEEMSPMSLEPLTG